MSRKMKFVSLVMVVVAIVLVFSLATVSAKTLRWRMTTSWPAGIPLYTDMAEVYAKYVETLSEGQIKIQVLPGGAIAPALEVTDTVAKGIAQLGHTWPGYDIGRDPTTAILGGYAGGMESVPINICRQHHFVGITENITRRISFESICHYILLHLTMSIPSSISIDISSGSPVFVIMQICMP